MLAKAIIMTRFQILKTQYARLAITDVLIVQESVQMIVPLALNSHKIIEPHIFFKSHCPCNSGWYDDSMNIIFFMKCHATCLTYKNGANGY